MNRLSQETQGQPNMARRRVASLPSALRGQRVVPLPLAVVAVAIPFLTAWASVDESVTPAQVSADQANSGQLGDAIRGSRAEARPLDEPLVFLGRDVRIPATEGGYVDIWAVPTGWEADLLQRRGR